jgi:N-acetylornithine carbamoyltransferase
MSVPQGLLMLMSRWGMRITLAHPPEYRLMPESMRIAAENAKRSGGVIEVVDNMADAFRDAEMVYPKSWGCESLFGKPDEAMRVAGKYKHWICDQPLMELTKPGSIYLHCLPADRGNEVTDEVIDGMHSRIYLEAENRLHTAKALMALTM